MIRRRNTLAFTMIELMLAMSFVAVLMMAITFLTIHVSNLYTRGVTLKEVNQTGLAITEDMQRTIGATAPFDINQGSGTSRYVEVADRGGRLCTGQYSYAWNYANSLQGHALPYTTYQDTNKPVRLVRVLDPEANLCRTAMNNVVDPAKTTNLLQAGERDLALYNFTISTNAASSFVSQALYTVSFTLGTIQEGQIDSVNKTCKPPKEGVGYEDYCAINEFNIVVRAGNSEGNE